MISTNKEKHDILIAKDNRSDANTSHDDAHKNKLERNLLTASFISGACAGAVAKTVIAPLDRTKIIFQVSETRFSYRKAFEILLKGYRKHGIVNWWRGNTATMARIVPYAAIQFTTHERLKIFFAKRDQNFLPKTKRYISGSLAGVFASIFTYPLDMIRARMAIAGKKKYKNLFNTITSVYRHEGLFTFYNGFLPTIMGIMPYAGTSFFVYETLKKKYHETHTDEILPTRNRLLFGGIAGACGQSLSYPLDIIRRRQQTDGLDGKGYRYRSMIWTVKYILRTEGFVKGLYKGLSINFLKGPVAVGVSFTTYDTCKMFLNQYMEFSVSDL